MRHQREWDCYDADFAPWDNWNDPHNFSNTFFVFMYRFQRLFLRLFDVIYHHFAASFEKKNCKKLKRQKDCTRSDFTSHPSCFYFDIIVIYRMFRRKIPMRFDCMFSSTRRDMNLCIQPPSQYIFRVFIFWVFIFCIFQPKIFIKYTVIVSFLISFWNLLSIRDFQNVI